MPHSRSGHQLQLLHGGEAYFAALVRAIDAAEHSVALETYIFDFNAEHGVASIGVARALARAAERGVAVQVLMDGAGTPELPLDWQAVFDEAGVVWRIYAPFGLGGLLQPRLWRRIHRKLCVVDAGQSGAVAFCGGINLLDDYFDPNHGVLAHPRFDFAVQVHGPLTAAVADAAAQLWAWSDAASTQGRAKLPALVGVLRERRSQLFDTLYPAHAEARRSLEQALQRSVRAQLLLRDNFKRRRVIEKAYLRAIGEARHEVWIANAYFLPGGKLRRALIQAAKRGVQVTLLLQGRYEYFLQWHAARPLYAALMQAGVRIVEYETSFLHAKVAVVDAQHPQAWATVGSSNLDPLSLLLAREANVVVHDSAFATELRDALVRAVSTHGKLIDPTAFEARGWAERALNWVGHAVMRAGLWLLGQRY